jgi:hypothetical protein
VICRVSLNPGEVIAVTSTDVMRMLLRRWYVVGAGIAITLAVMVSVYQRPGVFSARTDVVFLAPESSVNPNKLAVTSNTLIATAGVVEEKINRGHNPILPVSPDVPLVAQGVTDGWQVFVPNYGGQWAVNYERASITSARCSSST